MGKLSNYFKNTKHTLSWKIYYRNRPTGSILSNDDTPFMEYKLDKGFWGADPLLFEYKNRIYLFFELFDVKKKKGSIACAEIVDGLIREYTIVLDLDYHLSFPFVFEHNGCVYMIPETGATKSIRLFKSTSFPYKWVEEKTIVNDIDSSDNIVYKDNQGNIFLIASIMDGTPSFCHNEIYLLDDNLNIIKLIAKTESSTNGIRNAGQLFSFNGVFMRPGQECEDMNYGKGLVFFVQLISTDKYSEEKTKTIFPSDVSLLSDGIHTYSSTSRFEVIDSKHLKCNSLLKRMSMVLERLLKKIFNKK